MLTVTGQQHPPTKLQEHIAATYFTSRVGLGVIACLFPIVLTLGGWAYAGLPLQDSLSAYYHAGLDDRSMRTFFVGILFALAALLYLYKGYSVKENVVLNIAAGLAVLVAVFPMEWDCGSDCSKWSIHGASAIGAFACIAFVAAFCAGDTLRLIRDPKRVARYKSLYRVLAALMFISPLAAFVAGETLGLSNAFILIAEWFGLWAFSAYWFAKVSEVRQTHADLLAVEGHILTKEAPAIADGEPVADHTLARSI